MEYLIVIIAVIAFNVFAASAKKRGGADGGSGGGADMSSGRGDLAGGFGSDSDSNADSDSDDVGDGYYPEAEMSRGGAESSGEDFDGAREFVERLKRERAERVRGGAAGEASAGGAAMEKNFGGSGKPFTYGGTLREVPDGRGGEFDGGFGEDAGGASRGGGRGEASNESGFDAELRMLRERSESLQNTLRSIRDFEEQNKIARSVGVGAEGADFGGAGFGGSGEIGSASGAEGAQSSGYVGGFFASKGDLRRAVLASEILGKPVSLGK